MKNFYILITSDYNQKSAYEIFKNRLREKKFPLYVRTPNLDTISIDDEILFYIAGKNLNAQSFVGKSTISQIQISKELIVDADKTKNLVNRFLIFKDIELFKNSKKIKVILNELNFIKIKKHYGLYLLGGVVKINKDDFQKILNN